MMEMSLKGQKLIIVAVTSIGLLGALLFFPMNIRNRYTCLYHRMLFQEATTDNSPPAVVLFPHHDSLMANHVHPAGDLVREYVFPFGILWWGSILLLVISFHYYVKLKRISSRAKNNHTKNEGLVI